MATVYKKGSEFSVGKIAVFDNSDQTYPKATALNNGDFVVTWSQTTSGVNYDICAQIFKPNGGASSGVFIVNGDRSGNQFWNSITALDGGGFVVTWDNGNINARIFNDDGSALGDDFIVNTETAGVHLGETVAPLSGGGFIISWHNYKDSVGSRAQIFDKTGAKVGNELILSSQTYFFNIDEAGQAHKPAIASLANGNFVVAISEGCENLGDNSGLGVSAQIYSPQGQKIGDKFLVNTEIYADQLSPSIAVLEGGNFVITWQDYSAIVGDIDGSSIKSQLFDSSGQKIGGDILVNSQTLGDQIRPCISSLNNGGYVISWQNFVDASVNAQVFTENGLKAGEVIESNFGPLWTIDGWSFGDVAGLTGGGFAQTAGVKFDSQLGAPNLVKVQLYSVNFNPEIFSNGGLDSCFLSIVEKTTFVTKIVSKDPDRGSVLVYSISGGADANMFIIDPQDGNLSFKSGRSISIPYDVGRDNIYDVIVTVSDGSLTDSQAISIKLIPENHSPSILSNGGGVNAALSISENVKSVTTVAGSDPDAMTTLVYSIIGGDDKALFRINSTTGALSFKSAADFESPKDSGLDNVYDVIVKVSDGSLSDTQALAITVQDIANELLVGTSRADTLTGAGGNDTLKGAAGNDKLYGNGGNDILDGGKGADRMEGGVGNDIYTVDNAGDVVVEATGNGRDTVKASVSYALAANVENLSLTGSATLGGRGNELANTIVGNAGDNILMGFAGNDNLKGSGGSDTLSGGAGKDVLTGGTGQDFFVFDTAANATNVDKITDFNFGDNDKVQLSKAVFKGFNHLGSLTNDEFYAAAGAKAAHDASDRVIYDTASGKLFYDADGQGGAAAVQVALLGSATHPVLIYSDIQIVA